jgi:hypothetical protein
MRYRDLADTPIVVLKKDARRDGFAGLSSKKCLKFIIEKPYE